MRRKCLLGRHGRGRLLVAVTAGLIAAAVAACGSSSANSGTSASAIKIGVATVVIPGTYDAQSMYNPAVKAALGYIQEHGGWGGQQVTTVNCVSAGTPAADTTCYRQFISQKVTAVIGILPQQASIGYPLMSKAGIPSFMIGASHEDDLSPWENEISGSAAAGFTSAARYACSTGAKTVSVLRDDIASAQESYSLYAAGILRACGIQVSSVAAVPYGAADLATYVTKAVSTHPDMLIALATASGTAEVDAIASAGYPASKVISPSNPTQQFLADPATNGVILTTGWQFPVPQNSNVQNQAYLQAMKKYSPGADPGAQLSFPAFQAVLTIWDAAKAIGFAKVTGTGIQNYMNNQASGHLQIFGGPPTTVQKMPGSPGNKQPYVDLSRWQNGKPVDLGWWQAGAGCTSQASCTEGHVSG